MRVRHWEAIAFFAAIIATLLTAGICADCEIKRAVREVEAERDLLREQLDLYRDQLRIMDTRLAELEALLNLTSALEDTGMAGLGPALMTAGKVTGTDPYLLAAICAHESGWGTSRLAREKNNLAGLGAYDHSPGSAIRFESREECVMFLAELLRDRPGTLEQVGTWYASDPAWAQKVAGCMKIIAGRVTP